MSVSLSMLINVSAAGKKLICCDLFLRKDLEALRDIIPATIKVLFFAPNGLLAALDGQTQAFVVRMDAIARDTATDLDYDKLYDHAVRLDAYHATLTAALEDNGAGLTTAQVSAMTIDINTFTATYLN